METSSIITLLIIALLLLTLTKESLNFITKYPIIFALIVILILLGYYYFVYRKTSYIDKIKDEVKEELKIDSNDVDDDEIRSTPEDFDMNENNITIEKGGTNINTVQTIDYEMFAKIMYTKDFLNKFKNSMVINYKLKKRKYIDVYNATLHELNSLNKGGKISMKTGEKAETISALESSLLEIEDILKQIDKDSKELTIEKIKSNLSKAINDPKNGLNTLIARDNVKDFLAVRLYTFAMNPRIFFNSFQHVALYGRSGFGKSKIGEVMAFVYSMSGILIKNNFMAVNKSAFTTAYVNSSGSKTKSLLLANLESVLLIDEAYDLGPPAGLMGDAGHTNEAIATMVDFLSKYKGLSIVIIAGYEKQMKERLMNSNEGLDRRFPHILKLSPFTPKILTKLCINFIRNSNPQVKISQENANLLYSIINKIQEYDVKYKKNYKDFVFSKQAGDMENLAAEISQCYYTIIPQGDLSNAIILGINNFLKGKNIHISIPTI